MQLRVEVIEYRVLIDCLMNEMTQLISGCGLKMR